MMSSLWLRTWQHSAAALCVQLHAIAKMLGTKSLAKSLSVPLPPWPSQCRSSRPSGCRLAQRAAIGMAGEAGRLLEWLGRRGGYWNGYGGGEPPERERSGTHRAEQRLQRPSDLRAP